jgi:hypothetical protein
MKEIGRFFEGADALPSPNLAPPLGLQKHPIIVQAEDKMVLEGGISLINAQWEESPDGQPKEKPKKGEKQKGQNLYLLESQ